MRFHFALALGVAAALISSATIAAEPTWMADPDPIYDSPMFNFEGFYAGIQGGGANLPGPGVVGTAGIVAGANFTLSESILAGLEFQGEGLWNGGGYVGFNALILARVGGYVTPNIMAYGAVGGGLVNGAGSYALGAGAEMPLMSQLSARAELMGTGTWGAMPNGAKAAVGLLWHMN